MSSTEENKKPASSNKQFTRQKLRGRSARRRRAKFRAIQKAEETLWRNGGESAGDVVAPTPIAPDREKVWLGVLERRKGALTNSEQAALVSQLGYLPGNAIAVAARASVLPPLPLDAETPIVLQLYPLAVRDAYAGGKSDGRKFKGRRRGGYDANSGQTDVSQKEVPLLEPFPTLYWITHPLLRTLISKLEMGTTHNVSIMQKRLRSDEVALASMKRAHQAYGLERWEVLTRSDLQLVESRKWQGALNTERGVSGTRQRDQIKCLHAHAAHYLSGGKGSADNVVGKWVVDAVLDLLRQGQ